MTFYVQECVRVRGEEFVTSLGSLTEKLMHQLDDLLTPAGEFLPIKPNDDRKSILCTFEVRTTECHLG